MTLQFRRLNESPSSLPASAPPDLEPWVPLASQTQAEAGLFYFLQGLIAGRYQTHGPLLLTSPLLHALYQDPHPSLQDALHHLFEQLRQAVHPDPHHLPLLQPTPHIWSLVLAAYHCFLPQLPATVIDFMRALIPLIPPARTLDDALFYHAILRLPVRALASWPPTAMSTYFLLELLNRSPLTALYALEHQTPPPLTLLAAALLRWRKNRLALPDPWLDLADWLTAVTPLLADPWLVAYLHRRWLTLCDDRHACRNLGVFLEALRLSGQHRDFILAYYNAYAYTTCATDKEGKKQDHWPALTRLNRFLRPTNNDERSALNLAYRGSENFLHFWPLIQLVAAEGQLPGEPYRYINHPFALALNKLTNYAAIGTATALRTGPLEFATEDTK